MAHQRRMARSARHRMRRWLSQRSGGSRAIRTMALHRCGQNVRAQVPGPSQTIRAALGSALTTDFTLAPAGGAR
jgi:hypothetical protein